MSKSRIGGIWTYTGVAMRKNCHTVNGKQIFESSCIRRCGVARVGSMSMFFYSRCLNFLVGEGRNLHGNYSSGHSCVRAEEVEDRKRVTWAVKEWGALTTYHLVLPRYRHDYVQWRSPVVNI